MELYLHFPMCLCGMYVENYTLYTHTHTHTQNRNSKQQEGIENMKNARITRSILLVFRSF
jgi:hypothetical protein